MLKPLELFRRNTKNSRLNYFTVKTEKRIVSVNITHKVKDIVKNISSGLIFLYVPHTTAGLFVNESADPDVTFDINKKLSELVPYGSGYRHFEGNSDSHIKSVIVGNQLFFFVENGELQLGTWGGIFFAEFDGPRERKVYYKIVET